jgi:alanine racemase
LNVTLPVHFKIDTGMGRLGIQWDDVETTVPELLKSGGIEPTGVCSHFATVNPQSPNDAINQVNRFKHALLFLPNNLFRHFSSSRAAFYFPEWDFSGIRQGISLYGYGTEDPKGRFRTEPILQWKTRIIQIKSVPAGYRVGYVGTHTTEYPTRLAVIAVGYADGYNRALSNRGDVLVRGKRCAVVGRVSMNWVTVDLGPDLPAEVGDEVVLIGEQGKDAIWASELSRICRTIPYEILPSINASIERHYKGIDS